MNTTNKIKGLIILFAFAHIIVSAQSVNWYQEEKTSDTPYNINTNTVYEKLLKNKTGRPVVVAVIDSGIDVEHEDLRDIIWVNTDEIPDNNIDDDLNGYVDDINGWNFIGGSDGTPVAADTYEMTRLYAQYRTKFADADLTKLSNDDKELYEDYVKFGKRIENETKKAKTQYDEFDQRYSYFSDIVNHIIELKKDHTIDEKMVDSLSTSFNQSDAVTANIYNFYHDQTGSYPDVPFLKEELLAPLEEALDHFGSKYKYNWNPDFEPRHIVGDDYNNVKERYYGNNLVEGPDAMHGTHVAGIIAASRNNEIGLNGIAENVRIMAIRAVPNGDERDKDVANAIRYAVENGASIINMSFGKGASPDKNLVDDAIRYAEKKDVLIVHAAGNSGKNLETADNFPNDHFIKPKGFLCFRKKQPKNYITIGASGPSAKADMAAEFSNYSIKDVDLFAPGVMILSTVPDDRYEEQQGTSMAAPVISGVAAILRSYFPALTAEQVKKVLIESTSPISTMVLKPGTDELVPFSSLSVSGGIVDIQSAFIKASQTKGKKKLKNGGKVKA